MAHSDFHHVLSMWSEVWNYSVVCNRVWMALTYAYWPKLHANMWFCVRSIVPDDVSQTAWNFDVPWRSSKTILRITWLAPVPIIREIDVKWLNNNRSWILLYTYFYIRIYGHFVTIPYFVHISGRLNIMITRMHINLRNFLRNSSIRRSWTLKYYYPLFYVKVLD